MRRLAALALAALFALAALPAAADTHTEKPSLYKRLGGYDALAAATDDFIGRMAADPKLAKFFAGHSKDSLARIRQLVVDQLCAATGGPCVYIGRDMKSSHQGMGITEADWNRAVGHLVATLDKFKVPEQEKAEFLALASTLKADIVEQKPAGGHAH
jgi:hemoglobin